MRAPSRATVVAKNSTKVRPVAYATNSTPAPSLGANAKAGSGHRGEHAATADLSDRKHEDFAGSSGAPAKADMRSAIGVNHLGNFLEMRLARCLDLSLKRLSAGPASGNLLLRQVDQFAIEVSVAAGWIAPRHVGRHAVALNPPPGGNVVERGASPLQDAGKIFGRDRSKFEPGLLAAGGGQIPGVDDGILQPANTGHDRNRAVPQGAKLCQTARLEPRRHHERIHAGLNQVGQNFIMSDRNAHLFRIGLCGGTVAILQRAIPAPQQGQLHSVAYDRRQIFEKKIDPLLPGQTTDDAEQKRIGRHLQTKPPLQGRLVDRPVLQNVRLQTTGHVCIERS
jgi:hypothetical protein